MPEMLVSMGVAPRSTSNINACLAICVLHASSRARGCDLVWAWRSGGAILAILRVGCVGLCAGAQAQGCVARLLGLLDQLTGGGPGLLISVLNAHSLA